MRKITKMVVTLGVAAAITAAPAAADLVKCQAAIEKNGTKLHASILKVLGKCKDGYRKALVTNTVATAAATCQGSLFKTIDTGNPVSAIIKTKTALDGLTNPLKLTCTDQNLQDLGHLPPSLADGSPAFGNRWSSLVILEAFKSAYETQASLVGDFPNVLVELAKNGCTMCGTLAETPPCLTNACRVDGSQAKAKVITGAFEITIPLDGFTITGGCKWGNLLSNELGFVGTVNTGLKPTLVSGSQICNVNFRTEGIYSCAGSTAPRINYTTCQDSNKNDGANECPVAATTVCQPDPDVSSAVPPVAQAPYGACATLTTAAGGQGTVFVLSTTRLRTSLAVGGDGVPCTDDDTYNTTPPAQIPITTGTVSAELRDFNDANGVTGTEGPDTGTPGPSCPTIIGGSSAGLALAGAFPSADTQGTTANPIQDIVTRLKLTCLP